MIDENTKKILNHIKTIFNEKEKFCSEEEFRYWFLPKNCANQEGKHNYSLEYPFKYHKKHNDHIYKDNVEPEANVKNAKVDAILWDPEDPTHGLCAFEFKYAHTGFKDIHGRDITGSSPTIDKRYDFLEDIDRLESLFDDKNENNDNIHIDVGYAIFLTNITAYRTPAQEGTKVSEVSIEEGAKYSPERDICVSGEGNDKYYKPLVFRSEYTIHWNQIDGTKFWCCIVEVKPKGK